jgi:hypothetical protein
MGSFLAWTPFTQNSPGLICDIVKELVGPQARDYSSKLGERPRRYGKLSTLRYALHINLDP